MGSSGHPLETAEAPLGPMTEAPKGRVVISTEWDEGRHGHLVEEYLKDPNKLAGAANTRPNFAIETERPEHRMILILAAQGMAAKDIAKRMQYSYGWVLQVQRQGWFRKRLLEMIHEAGADGVDTFLKGEVSASLLTLREVRDNEGSKNSDRIAAANALLDRAMGKPTQHVKTERVSSADDSKKELETIEAELAAIRGQQSIIIGGATKTTGGN